jgi:hypothetical protein
MLALRIRLEFVTVLLNIIFVLNQTCALTISRYQSLPTCMCIILSIIVVRWCFTNIHNLDALCRTLSSLNPTNLHEFQVNQQNFKNLQAEAFTTVSKESFAAPRSKLVKTERRRVSFKPSVSVRPIVHVNDISESEIKATWYCRYDFANMKKAFALTTKMISHGVYPGGDDEHCARGLEYRIRSGALARRENKTNGLKAVFDERDRQIQCGVVDDELIRQAFTRENIQCRLSALQMGIRDQDEAELIHGEDEEHFSEDELVDYSSDSDEEMDYCDMYQARLSTGVSTGVSTQPHLQSSI